MLWRGANTNLHFPLLDGGGFNQIMTCQRRFLFFSNRLFKQCVEHWILCFHWYLRFIPMKFNIAHKSDLPKRKVVFRYKCFLLDIIFFCISSFVKHHYFQHLKLVSPQKNVWFSTGHQDGRSLTQRCVSAHGWIARGSGESSCGVRHGAFGRCMCSVFFRGGWYTYIYIYIIWISLCTYRIVHILYYMCK